MLEVVRIAGSLPAIVFLHEGLGSVAMWRDWPQKVCSATGHAGLVYSRLGYGNSSPFTGKHRPDYMHTEALEVLPSLLKDEGISTPILLGHSDGGTIALIYAAHHPVASCIVMAPHVIVEDISVKSIEQAREAYVNADLRERLKRYHADVDSAFWQWNDIWLDPAFRAFDIREETKSISAPVLAIQGVDDPYGTLRQIEEIRAPNIEREIVPNCGHSPHRDQPELVTARTAAFLA